MRKTLQLLLICLVLSSAAIAQQSDNQQIIDLTTQSFKQKVWDFNKNKTFSRVGDLPIILDFHATWCPPCKKLAPHLQALQKKYANKLIVYKIDVDKEPKLAELFKVNAMPTIIFMNSKTTFTSELGYKDYAQFDALINAKFFSK